MEKIIIDLEAKTDKAIDDIKKLNKELNNTSKSSKDASDSLNNTSSSLDNSSNSAKKLASSFEEVKDNGGAIAILDSLTGGLATRVRDAYEATKLFNFSLKGTKKALIATGIGALVVVLGTVIAYWDDITKLIEGVNRKLKYQEENLQKQLKTQTLQLDLLKQQIAIEELRNGFSPKLTAEYKKQLLIQREQNIALLENLQTQLDIEESKNKEVTLWEKIKIATSGQLGIGFQAEQIAKSTNETSEKSIEIQEKLNEAKKKTGAIDLELAQIEKDAVDRKLEVQNKIKELEEKQKEKEKVTKKKEDEEKALKQKEKTDKETADAKALSDLKNQIRNAEAVTEEERRLLEIEKTTEHYNKLIELAKIQGLSTVALEEAKTKALDKLNQTASKNETYWAKLTQQEKARVVSQGLNNLSTILGEESAAGKAAAIASATISTYQSATDSYKSLAGIPIIGPALGFAAAGAAVTAGFANVKKIVSTKTPGGKGGGGSPSISGGGSAPSAPSIPPSFNVVGASSTNQLAEAIGGQSKEPVKAYVVSNDVTTAQSLDRNIVNSASI